MTGFGRKAYIPRILPEPTMRKFLAAIGVIVLFACGGDSSGPSYGPPTSLLILAGAATQTGAFGQAVPIAPAVLVTDASNRPVPDVAVTFTPEAGSGVAAPVTVNTNASGSASVVWTMGTTFGSKTLTASAAGLPSVTFKANAIAPDAGIPAFSITDPAGDTLANDLGGAEKAIDIVSIRGDFKRDSLIVTATFNAPVSPGSSAENSLGGILEFDMDDNVATGIGPASNFFGATASVGIEYQLDMFDSDGVTFVLYNADSGAVVKANFSGSTVTARIPMSRLSSDDGNFSIVGVIGTAIRPTDVFPNAGQGLVRRGNVSQGSFEITGQKSLLVTPTLRTSGWGPRPGFIRNNRLRGH